MALAITLQTGEPVFGIWCPECLLPCAVRWSVHMMTSNGVADMGFAQCCNTDDGMKHYRRFKAGDCCG